MPSVFRTVQKRYNLPPGDFPEIKDFTSKLAEQDFSKFAQLRLPLIEAAELTLSTDIPRLMEALPRSVDPASDVQLITPDFPDDTKGDGNAGDQADSNPFGADDTDSSWCMDPYIPQYRDTFDQRQVNGFITGAAAKEILTASGLDKPSLRKIWELSDMDKDGQLSLEEYVIAMFLTSRVKEGEALPAALDPEMIPPSRRL